MPQTNDKSRLPISKPPPKYSERGFIGRRANHLKSIEVAAPSSNDTRGESPPPPIHTVVFERRGGGGGGGGGLPKRKLPARDAQLDGILREVNGIADRPKEEEEKQQILPAKPKKKKPIDLKQDPLNGPLDLKVSSSRPIFKPPKLPGSSYDFKVALSPDGAPMFPKDRDRNDRKSMARRRSSLGLRGKRVSTGSNGLCPPPHMTIDPSDYYRHLDADQSDPMKMRQLLLWCAQRDLEDPTASHNNRPDKDEFAELERAIWEEMVAGLMNKEINTSWYKRPPTATENEAPKKLPHPHDEVNAKKVAELTVALERLEAEQKQWIELMATYEIEHAKTVEKHESATQRGLEVDVDHAQAHWDALLGNGAEAAADGGGAAVGGGSVEEYLSDEDLNVLKNMCTGALASEIDAWTEETLDAMQIEVDHMHHVLGSAECSERKTRRFVDDLFGRVLRAYDEKEKKVADPMDLLRLLAAAPPAAVL
ncbi:hypothetical protein HK104_006407 [Borealophlyctis nickersoniae]|nr:hypothetical protein HK104_006407 [Borealophlyctis nickersoniae]